MTQSETKLTLKTLAAELEVTPSTVRRAATVYERLLGKSLARQGREVVLIPQQYAHLRRAVQLAHRYEPGLERVLTEELASSRAVASDGVDDRYVQQGSGVSQEELQTFRVRVRAYREKEARALTVGRLMEEASPFTSAGFFPRFSYGSVRRVLCEIVRGLRGGRPFAYTMELSSSEYQMLQQVAEHLDWDKVMALDDKARYALVLDEVERVLQDLKQ